MKGIFTRISPVAFSEKSGIPPGWFVISPRYMPDKKIRRLGHVKWFKLTSQFGSIYRILRFSVNLKGSPNRENGIIVLDWMGWIDLWDREEDIGRDLEINFSEVKLWQYPLMALSHPDPTYRLASVLAIISVILGVLSFVLAIWAL